MYNIIKEQNETFNGLGGTNAPNAKTTPRTGGGFVNVTDSLTNAANSVANITNAFANLKSAKNSGQEQQPVYVYNGQTATETGSGTNNAKADKGMSDYLPWIIGGGVLLVGLMLMNKKR